MSMHKRHSRCHSSGPKTYYYGGVTNRRPATRCKVASPAASILKPAGTDSNPQPKPSPLDELAILNDLTIVKKIDEIHKQLYSMEARQVSMEARQNWEAQVLFQSWKMNFSILNSISNSIYILETSQIPALLGVPISTDQIPPPTERRTQKPLLITRRSKEKKTTNKTKSSGGSKQSFSNKHSCSDESPPSSQFLTDLDKYWSLYTTLPENHDDENTLIVNDSSPTAQYTLRSLPIIETDGFDLNLNELPPSSPFLTGLDKNWSLYTTLLENHDDKNTLIVDDSSPTA